MSENNEIAIKVQHISKTFHEQAGSRSFKEAFVGVGRKLTGKKEKKLSKGDYTALKDINFEVKKGEFFGIVGRNGSGKSTLLKIIAGVYTPTKGAVITNGNLTPFIELGVGFNPELSGRDNVFLNGALLGFTRKQMEEMYDDIVEFAELKDFMDVKLKNYSSGMQVRLAFSVAIRADSDILLIDEVLAVGDMAFQQKCFRYFDKLKMDKRSIVFVTHDMGSVRQFCDRALYVEKGNIIKIGTPTEISNLYDNKNISTPEQVTEDSIEKIKVTLKNDKNKTTDYFNCNENITIGVDWGGITFSDKVLNVGVIVYRGAEVVFATNTKKQLDLAVSSGAFLKLKTKLGDGRYRVFVGLFGGSMHDAILISPNASHFTIVGNNNIGDHNDEWQGLMYIENEWRTNV